MYKYHHLLGQVLIYINHKKENKKGKNSKEDNPCALKTTIGTNQLK